MSEFQVRRKNLAEHRIVEASAAQLVDGAVRVAIDRFAFTANNITYGVAGDMLGYWKFFPALDNDNNEWGVLPVWGFADVLESRCGAIAVGERFFGYFPPAGQLLMHPQRISDAGFSEGASHRAELPPAYNSYRRVSADPAYDSRMDELHALLFPLYITSFCLWDSLQQNDWYGAAQIVVLSATSKTSLGLAHALRSDEDAPDTVGVTSADKVAWLAGIDWYDRELPYNDLTALPQRPTVIVDMSGNSSVLATLHQQLGDNMIRTLNVGITHWSEPRQSAGVIAERCEMFFAPGHIQQRYKDWGPAGFEQQSGEFLQRSISASLEWLEVTRLAGLQGLEAVYADVCVGAIAPDAGLIVEM